MGHPTMQENDTAKLTPTIMMLQILKIETHDQAKKCNSLK